MELNPLMLTLLGVGAGILVVVVLVAVAIRFHAARGRNGGVGLRYTESATNKVVVTTIEDLDLDNGGSAQGLMLLTGGIHGNSCTPQSSDKLLDAAAEDAEGGTKT